VNTHLNYFDRLYGNFPLVKRELISLGVKHLRDGAHLQNDDYNAAVYGRWNELGKIGIRFDAVVDPRSNLGPITPDLLERVYLLSGETIESFEGPNEMDLSGIENWATVDRDFNDSLFRAAREMRDAAHVKVIGPSMAFASHGGKVGNISTRNDFGNLHSYPAGKLPSTIFPEQTELARDLSGANDIMITESGYHNALNDHTDQPAVSEAAAAKYVTRLFLENFTHSIQRTYLYELLDEKPDPALKDNQLHWGMVRADGSEKPAFTALKNLIGELRDNVGSASKYSLTWTLENYRASVDHLLLRKSNGELDLIVWQEVSSFDTHSQTDIENEPLQATLVLPANARSVVLYEPVLQAGPLRTFNGVRRIPIQIPDHPLVIQIVMP
jgi:hypothetical protein